MIPATVPLETRMMITMAVVLIVGAFVVMLMMRMGQPAVIGEILAGIALGPSVLGLLPGNLVDVLFPPEIRPHLHAIAQVGLLLFMFVTGWEFDLAMLRRRAWTIAFTSVSAMATPFVFGVLGAVVLYAGHADAAGRPVERAPFLLYMGTAVAITAFPVLARLLVDKGLQHGRLGTMALACAAAGDVLAWCLLAVVVIIVQARGTGPLLFTLTGSLVLIGLFWVVLRPLLRAFVRRATRSGTTSPLFLLVSAGVLVSSYLTSLIGLQGIFGAFLFGLIMPQQPADVLRPAVEVPLRNISVLLLPVFFIVTGLSVDVSQLGPDDLVGGSVILTAACLGKLAGTTLPARMSGMSWRESAGLGVLMNTRGLTELIVIDIGRQLHVIDGRMFTLLTLMAIVTTTMTAPLLELLRLVPEPAHREVLVGGAVGHQHERAGGEAADLAGTALSPESLRVRPPRPAGEPGPPRHR